MSISSTIRRAGPYIGNDSAVKFPFFFKVFKAGELTLTRLDASGTETVLTLGTDYQVQLNAGQDNNPGGTVTLTVPPASGTTLTITSAVPQLQPMVLTNLGGFYPEVINDEADRAIILVQQLQEQVYSLQSKRGYFVSHLRFCQPWRCAVLVYHKRFSQDDRPAGREGLQS